MELGWYEVCKSKEEFQVNYGFNENALGMVWNMEKDVYPVH